MEKIERIENINYVENELEAMKIIASEWKDLYVRSLERNRNLLEYVRSLEKQNGYLNNMLLEITSSNMQMEYEADEIERLK